MAGTSRTSPAMTLWAAIFLIYCRLWLWVLGFARTTTVIDNHFVSGQPLSFAVKNALSPGTTASCL
jgi:hypothetical protein